MPPIRSLERPPQGPKMMLDKRVGNYRWNLPLQFNAASVIGGLDRAAQADRLPGSDDWRQLAARDRK